MPQKTGLVLAYNRKTLDSNDTEMLLRLQEEAPSDRDFLIKIGMQALHYTDERGVSLDFRLRKFIKGHLTKFGIFADFKPYDTGDTVAESAREFVSHGPFMATCAYEIAREEGCRTFADICNKKGVLPIGVTFLTDISEDECKKRFLRFPREIVVERARHFLEWGFKGVTCSGRELTALSESGLLARLETVVPGPRLPGDHTYGQKRVVTPGQAVQWGANYLVVGRPILGEVDSPKPTAEASVNVMLQYIDAMDKAS